MKTMRFLLVMGVFLANFSLVNANFVDVHEDETYAEAIAFLEERGVINGYPDGTFRADNPLSRAELLKILIEAVGTTDQELAPFIDQACFEDVPAGEWFTKYVCYGKNEGFVVGYENGRFFRPAQEVTVVEAIKMTLAVFGVDFEEGTEPWYRGVVDAAAENQLIPPTATGFNKPLNRGEMAELATRSVKNEEGTLDEHLEERGEDEPVDFDELQERENRYAFYPAVAVYEFFGDDYKNRFALHFIPDALASEIDDPQLTYFTTLDNFFVKEGETIGVYSDSSFIDEDKIADSFAFMSREVSDEECLYIDIYDFSLIFPENFNLQEVLGDFDLAHFKRIGMISQRTESMNFVTKNVCDRSEDGGVGGTGGRKIVLESHDPNEKTPEERFNWLESYIEHLLDYGNPSWDDYNYAVEYLDELFADGLSAENYDIGRTKILHLKYLIETNESYWNG